MSQSQQPYKPDAFIPMAMCAGLAFVSRDLITVQSVLNVVDRLALVCAALAVGFAWRAGRTGFAKFLMLLTVANALLGPPEVRPRSVAQLVIPAAFLAFGVVALAMYVMKAWGNRSASTELAR
ncbi:MAG: hypothetical protein K8R56_05855 [Candidatus Eisenbacteria bacterium]|nr:hypothetical protein [Candidatus Eisenbacteria bacterium]